MPDSHGQFNLFGELDGSRLLRRLVDALSEAHELRDELTIAEAREFLLEHAAGLALDEESFDRYAPIWRNFEGFTAAQDVTLVSEVTEELVAAFVAARHSRGGLPSISIRHLRRAAVRFLFETLRGFGLSDRFVAIDLELPQREYPTTRPVTDPEIDSCRAAALPTQSATRFAATWALAEAGATMLEIGAVAPRDVYLHERRVWIAGGPNTRGRWGHLTEWGAKQLARRLEVVGPDAKSLTYEGDASEHSRRTGTQEVVKRILRDAGLRASDGVRSQSIRAWLAAGILAEGGSIDEVARRLGVRTLDQAAKLAGFRWQEPWL